MEEPERNIIDTVLNHTPMLVVAMEDGTTITAHPCACNEPMDPEAGDAVLVRWDNGEMMLCHEACLREFNEG